MAQVPIPVGGNLHLMAAAAAPPSPDDAFLRSLASARDAKPRNGRKAGHRGHPPGRIRKISHKQSHSKSCAAAALLCASWEMGLISHDMSARRAKGIETDFHRRMVEIPGAPPDQDGATTISIVRAAETMGLGSMISLSKSAIPREGAKAQADLINRAGIAGIAVLARRPMDRPLDNTSRRILMVDASKNGVKIGRHCVLERPDKSVMDPIDGSNHEDLAHLNRALAKRGIRYRPYGIAVDLKRAA
jgi:hypothetical protein